LLGGSQRGGPRIALVTSFLHKGRAEEIEMLAVTNNAAWRIVTPLIAFEIMPNGTGDAVAALFTAHWLASGDVAQALAQSASSIYAVLEATQTMGEPELQLVAGQDRLGGPPRAV